MDHPAPLSPERGRGCGAGTGASGGVWHASAGERARAEGGAAGKCLWWAGARACARAVQPREVGRWGSVALSTRVLVERHMVKCRGGRVGTGKGMLH